MKAKTLVNRPAPSSTGPTSKNSLAAWSTTQRRIRITKRARRKAAKAYEAYDKAVAGYGRAKMRLRNARRADRVAARDLFHATLFSEMPTREFLKRWRKSGAAAFASIVYAGGDVPAKALPR